MAVATSSIPDTGVPLPFISSGGSALVLMMAGIGLLLNIFTYPNGPRTGVRRKRNGPHPLKGRMEPPLDVPALRSPRRSSGLTAHGSGHRCRANVIMREIRILVTGGGDGRPCQPALAVVQTLREWPEGAAGAGAFSMSAVQEAWRRGWRRGGDRVRRRASGKLRRTRCSVGEPARPLRVPVGVGQALGAVRRFRPDVVLATGGYVSVPPVVAAGLLGIPVLIHEQTVQVGLANRIAARFARRIALTFEGALATCRAPAGEGVCDGQPGPRGRLRGDRDGRSRAWLRDEDDALPTVYVTGGAQGAQDQRRPRSDPAGPAGLCRIIHQCGPAGRGHRQAVARGLPPELQRRYFVTGSSARRSGTFTRWPIWWSAAAARGR